MSTFFSVVKLCILFWFYNLFENENYRFGFFPKTTIEVSTSTSSSQGISLQSLNKRHNDELWWASKNFFNKNGLPRSTNGKVSFKFCNRPSYFISFFYADHVFVKFHENILFLNSTNFPYYTQ